MFQEFKLHVKYFEETFLQDAIRNNTRLPVNHFVLHKNTGQEDDAITVHWEAINNEQPKRGESTQGKLRAVITKAGYKKLLEEGLIHPIFPNNAETE